MSMRRAVLAIAICLSVLPASAHAETRVATHPYVGTSVFTAPLGCYDSGVVGGPEDTVGIGGACFAISDLDYAVKVELKEEVNAGPIGGDIFFLDAAWNFIDTETLFCQTQTRTIPVGAAYVAVAVDGVSGVPTCAAAGYARTGPPVQGTITAAFEFADI